jgi:hypothetical protein
MSRAYERVLAFLDDALAELEPPARSSQGGVAPARGTRPLRVVCDSGDRVDDRRADREGLRPR